MNIIIDELNRISFWGDQSGNRNDLSQTTNSNKFTCSIEGGEG
jgi:hypothetical protein